MIKSIELPSGFAMKFYLLNTTILYCFVAIFWGCNTQKQKSKLQLTGSSTVAPLLSEIGKAYEKQHPNVRIEVQTGGSSRGISDARSGLVKFGMASRALRSKELDLKSTLVAMDGIAIILHKNNPISKLSEEQIRSIFLDQTNSWADLKGNNKAITVVSKAAGRSTLELFLHHFKLDEKNIKPDIIIGDNEQGIQTVAGNPNAIGYVSIGSAEVAIQNGLPLQMLPMNNIEPSLKSVASGQYPLSRPLNLIYKGSLDSLQQSFLDFVTSTQRDSLIKSFYFAPLAR